MKIGMVIIATGRYYHQFIEPLLSSVDRYFLKGHDIGVHLWTDSTVQYHVKHQFSIERRPWPFPTLYRYHHFLQRSDLLNANDYLFYLDVDMRIVDEVGDELLSDGISATEHPGFAFANHYLFPYEQNPSSAAYLPRQRYFCGGFQGGRTDAYMSMARVIRDAIDADLARNIIACWHDESHYNKYLSTTPPSVILDPSYCYPEDALEAYDNTAVRQHYLGRWGRDFKPKILALKKQRPVGGQSAEIPSTSAAEYAPGKKRTGLRRLVHDLKVRWRGH